VCYIVTTGTNPVELLDGASDSAGAFAIAQRLVLQGQPEVHVYRRVSIAKPVTSVVFEGKERPPLA
jgi:hypothetical protein